MRHSNGAPMVRLGKRLAHALFGSFCAACGERSVPSRRPAISDELAAAWDINRRWRKFFDEREGCVCRRCGCSRRSQQMATVIASEVGRRVGQAFISVNDAARSEGFLSLSLAEINSCGALHQFWSDHPRLSYSEFGSTTPDVANQDLMALTYADETFDFVFTSETLEHVPDVSRALAEIRRGTSTRRRAHLHRASRRRSSDPAARRDHRQCCSSSARSEFPRTDRHVLA